MVERLVVGGFLVFLLSVELCLLVTIGLFLLLGAFVAVRRPYLKPMHNVRFVCNMLICIIIQAIYLGYKRATLRDQTKQAVWLSMPILVCVLLIICVVYNAVALVYELVRKPRDRRKEFAA